MDVQMPDMDGLEATRQIRALGTQTGQHIPIIAMTAHAMEGDRERCMESGMDDYVTKPLEPKVLLNALDRWIAPQTPSAMRLDAPPPRNTPFRPTFSRQETRPDSSAKPPLPLPSRRRRWLPLPQPNPCLKTLPVNFELALPRFGDDRDFMNEMFAEFMHGLPERLREIHESFDENDCKRLSRLAHNLKGVALNFDAAPLAGAALEIEKLTGLDDLAEARPLVDRLDAEAGRLQKIASGDSPLSRKGKL